METQALRNQIDAIVKNACTLQLTNSSPVITIKDGQVETSTKWHSEEAKTLYDESLELVGMLKNKLDLYIHERRIKLMGIEARKRDWRY